MRKENNIQCIRANVFINSKFTKGFLYFNNRILGFKKKKINKIKHVEDFSDYYLVPAFIDLQCNGAKGFSFIDYDQKKVNKFFKYLYSQGITDVFATFVSLPIKKLFSLISKMDLSYFAGLHIEGPFLNIKKANVHSHIRPIDIGFLYKLKKILNEKGFLKPVILTIAPELKNADKFVNIAKKLGFFISFGHSLAKKKDLIKFSKDKFLVTHMFNAMLPINHREGSLSLEALINDNYKIMLIADGLHVSLDILKLIKKQKKVKDIIIVTDLLSLAGYKKNIIKWGSNLLIRKKDKVVDKNNILAGSIAKSNVIFKNLLSVDFTFEDIIKMRSCNIACILNLEFVGNIKRGYFANFLILDKKLKIIRTYKLGKIVFQKDA